MRQDSRDFQVFVKPVGASCNLACRYCYYLGKHWLHADNATARMPADLLEEYIRQHLAAAPEPTVRFSWHGGEPTLAGVGYFRKIVALQHRHRRSGQRIENGIQTNGILVDEEWCQFLSGEGFAVGLSLDGPQAVHDRYRLTREGEPTFERVMRGYELLQRHGVACDILCVVGAHNCEHPVEVYEFFREIGAQYLTFLPLVEQRPEGGVSEASVRPAAWGAFLCTVFEKWRGGDVGRIGVQLFDEAARTATGQEHGLCIFRKTCGDVPVVEHNGDYYPCDHFVDPAYRLGNIRERSLVELLESPEQRAFGRAKLESLPRQCLVCEVREMCNGGCPKDRFAKAADGEEGLNYLCEGYRRFFRACRPFVRMLATLYRAQELVGAERVAGSEGAKVRRNDPCPCGSGRKYKNCCMPKGSRGGEDRGG